VNLKHKEITDLILKAFFEVYGQLGYGFLEKVYENSMVIVGRKLGLDIRQQFPVKVHFHDHVVGEQLIDLVVNNLVITELKAVRTLLEEHEAQLLNYLKATPFEVGLLLNFGPKPEYRSKIYDNERKGNLSWYKAV